MSLDGFTKSRSRISVPDVERNPVSNLWTADEDGALPELGPPSHDNSSCVMPRLHDQANIEQSSRKQATNAFKVHVHDVCSNLSLIHI